MPWRVFLQLSLTRPAQPAPEETRPVMARHQARACLQGAVTGWHPSQTIPGRWWDKRQLELVHPWQGPRVPWGRRSSLPGGLGRMSGAWPSRWVLKGSLGWGHCSWRAGDTQQNLQNTWILALGGPTLPNPGPHLTAFLCFSLFFIPYFDTGVQKLANIRNTFFLI